jgi:hypothetical protein
MEDVRVRNIFERLVQEDNLHFGFTELTEEQKQELFNDQQQKLQIIQSMDQNLRDKFSIIYNMTGMSYPTKYSKVLSLLNENIPGNTVNLRQQISSILTSAVASLRIANKQSDPNTLYETVRSYRDFLFQKLQLSDNAYSKVTLDKINENPSILIAVVKTTFTKYMMPMRKRADTPERYSTKNASTTKRENFNKQLRQSKLRLNDLYNSNSQFLQLKHGYPFEVTNSFTSSVETLLRSLSPEELICHWNTDSHWEREVIPDGGGYFAYYDVPIRDVFQTSFDEPSVVKGVGLYMENNKSFIIFAIGELRHPSDSNYYYIQPVIFTVTGGCLDGTNNNFTSTPMFAADFRGRQFLYKSFRSTIKIPQYNNDNESIANVELVHCFVDTENQRGFVLHKFSVS